MDKFKISVLFILFAGFMFIGLMISEFTVTASAQQESISPELKEAAVHDAACASATDAKDSEPILTEIPIRSGSKEVGAIVEVQGACHCQTTNCDSLVYLRDGQGYRLALHEKYASLHPMKIVKLGMPSLTGQFDVSDLKMETTVYDWNGKDYRPSLCATVVKGKKPPTITRHACKVPSH
jgi:hypothetical protein